MISKLISNLDKIRFYHDVESNRESKTIILIDTTPKTYIAFDPKTMLHKIGRSTNPELRIKNIERNLKTKLRIVFLIRKDVEMYLHKKYSNYHVFGEWHYLSQRSIEAIMAEF